jgi:hypothetical protein
MARRSARRTRKRTKPRTTQHLCIFGYTFTHLPEHFCEQFLSLEREGAIYDDHWIDEITDIRHVRIPFTPGEIADYARRLWAYELYLRAGNPKWARLVPGIDKDVARDADTYSPVLKDGTRIPPPCLWPAAFIGRHLESIVCGTQRHQVIDLQGKKSALFTLSRAVQALTPTMRTFNARERGLRPWTVSREDDVRDLLYVMLKPVLFDLVKEEPTPSLAGLHKLVDLSSRASRVFLEVKWIARKNQWKAVLGQIQVDIQCYPTHPTCDTLVFVVVDAVRDVPDPRLVEKEITGVQVVRGREVDIRLFIVEP